MIIYDLRLDEMIKPTKKPSRLGVVVKISNEVSKRTVTSTRDNPHSMVAEKGHPGRTNGPSRAHRPSRAHGPRNYTRAEPKIGRAEVD